MPIARRTLALATIGLPVTFTSFGAPAQEQRPSEGSQYRRLRVRQAVEAAGKIEVLEFFSYACPHCFDLEPLLQAWLKKRPADVVFHRVPVPFLVSAEVLTKSYYAFEELGLTEQMTTPMFAAMNLQHQVMASLKDVAALVARNGADGEKFLAVAGSFAIAGKAVHARKMLGDYGVDSTPTLIVQGLYETSPALAGGHQKALLVVDHLIASARGTAKA